MAVPASNGLPAMEELSQQAARNVSRAIALEESNPNLALELYEQGLC